MKCQLFETRLDELLDRRLSPGGDPQLTAHARRCPRCNHLLADYLTLSTAIESLSSPAVLGDLPARVLAEVAPVASHDDAVQPSERVRHRRIPAPAWLALAIAASLLVAIGIWGLSTWHTVPATVEPAPIAVVPHQAYGPIAMLSADEIKVLAGKIGAHQRVLIEEVSDELRPVTNPMSAALHALRRTLPRSEAPARSS